MKLLVLAVLVIPAAVLRGQDGTVLSVCELPERHEEFDEKEVAVRGRFVMGYGEDGLFVAQLVPEWVQLIDPKWKE